MSLGWSFYSFSMEKLQQLFPISSPESRTLAIEDLIWDEFDDINVINKVANHIVDSGLWYKGLDEHESRVLDGLIDMMFVYESEFIAPHIEAESLTVDIVHPTVIQELFDKSSAHLVVLPVLFFCGRRYGSNSTSTKCDYCVLTEKEVEILHEEVYCTLRCIEDLESTIYEIKTCFLDVLESAVLQGSTLYCSLG